jgi:hypothetical protein
MTATTFDTLKYAERLRAAGVPELQAKAQAQALADALREGGQDFATKADIAELRREMAEMKADIIKWVVGMAIAQISLLVWLLMKLL